MRCPVSTDTTTDRSVEMFERKKRCVVLSVHGVLSGGKSGNLTIHFLDSKATDLRATDDTDAICGPAAHGRIGFVSVFCKVEVCMC